MQNGRSRFLILAGAALWCIAIAAAPALRSAFQFHAIYDFFSQICHQDPARSWMVGGEPLPVCIRCACIYFGFFLGCLFGLRPNLRLLQVAVASTIGEFILARVLLDSAWLRGASGLFLGAVAAPFVILGVHEMLETRFRRDAV